MMPHSDDLSDFVNEPSPPKARSRKSFSLLRVIVLLVGIVGVLFVLLLPATRTAREPARRSQCINNLKQIALAIHNYEKAFNALPPAHTVDAAGRPLHSWRTLILPFLEQPEFYETIDLAKAWDDPANARARAKVLNVYGCPSGKLLPAGSTPYLAVVATDSCFLPDKFRPLSEITDNHGFTLMVIEVPANRVVHWMAPIDADESLVMSINRQSKLNHPGGMSASFVDGGVRFLSDKTPAAQRRAMISIAGRDDEAAKSGY